LPRPAAARAGGDVTGTWLGSVRVAGVERRLALQLQQRRSGEVYGYALGASPAVTASRGRMAAGRLTLQLDFVDPAATHVVTVETSLAGRRLTGFAREGTGRRALRLDRRSATAVLAERRIVLAPAAGGDTEPLTELVVALDVDGVLVAGGYAAEHGCGILGCSGAITAFREFGGVLDVDFEPADGCGPGSHVHAVFDPATRLYAGSYSLRTCTGSRGGALFGGRGTRARSDDVGAMLATLAQLADDLEARRPLPTPYPPFLATYLHSGATLADRLAELEAQIATHSALVVTFDRFRHATSVADPTTLPPLATAAGLQFHDSRFGLPLGGGSWELLRDADMRTLLENELQFFLPQKGGWVIAGDQLPELDLPFVYSFGPGYLKVPTPGGDAIFASVGPWGAHVSPHAGHAFGDPKANLAGFFAPDDGGLVELEGNGNGVREAGEVWGFDGGPGGVRVRERAPLYRSPYAGEVTGIKLESPPTGIYFDDPPKWQVEVQLANGMLLVLDHVGRLAPTLRDALLAATGIDSDRYVGPPAELLGGHTVPVAAHAPLAYPQVMATPVAGHPGFYRGGGSYPDVPWAQMEFRFEGPVGDASDSVCEFAHMRPARRAALQTVLAADVANPRSRRYTAPSNPQRWVWAAETALCLAYSRSPRGFDSLHTALGGWFERPSSGTTADELFSIFPIARTGSAYDPALYSSPAVTHLVLRRRRNDAGPFTWTLPGGVVVHPFYPNGEVLGETSTSLLLVWRDIVTVGDAWYQRAAYRLDAQGLSVKWGALAASPAAAVLPTLDPAEACDDATVLCYDHQLRAGF
jgi:hypothetical protein